MYNGFIFDEKADFYILTAFSSFLENAPINFEHKNFKSLIMLQNISHYVQKHFFSKYTLPKELNCPSK